MKKSQNDLCFLTSPKSLAATPRPSSVHLQRLQPILQDHWSLPNRCGGQAGVHQKGSLHKPKVCICGWRHSGGRHRAGEIWDSERRGPGRMGWTLVTRAEGPGTRCSPSWSTPSPFVCQQPSLSPHHHQLKALSSPRRLTKMEHQGARAPFCEVFLWPLHVPVTEAPGARAHKSTSDLPPC